MRIAFFTESFRENVGGLTRAVIQLHDGLVARGHQVRVFTLPQRGGAVHPGDHVFVPAVPLAGVGALAPDSWLAYGYPFVLRELGRFSPDVVHLHTPFPVSWLGVWAARRLSRPVVATYHANLVGSVEAYARRIAWGHPEWVLRFIGSGETRFYGSAHVVTAPSETAASQLLGRGLRAPVVVLSNGVDVGRFRPFWEGAPGFVASPLGRGRSPTALYVGRLSVEKGMADLTLAIRRLLQGHPSARFRVVGDGPWRSRLLRELQPWVCSGRLEIAGYVAWERLPQLYREADVFVFPSAVETQGLAVLEAMACGLPVVGVKGGAVPELVEDGKTGFMVSCGDGEALADAALRLLQDDDLRMAMARQARAMAVRHRAEAAIAFLEQIYESVIEARATRSWPRWTGCGGGASSSSRRSPSQAATPRRSSPTPSPTCSSRGASSDSGRLLPESVVSPSSSRCTFWTVYPPTPIPKTEVTTPCGPSVPVFAQAPLETRESTTMERRVEWSIGAGLI